MTEAVLFNVPHPDCGWVFAGEGVATRKLDGTSCMVRDNRLFKRREIKRNQNAPADFISEGTDPETGKTVGWVPVGDSADDKYHREAWGRSSTWPDGTYELIGPDVQGNPEKQSANVLIRHGESLSGPIDVGSRDFSSLKERLQYKDIEWLVFHHPDGRMAKIKLRDFGLKRANSECLKLHQQGGLK